MNRWANTIVDFGCISFYGLTPAGNFQNWWVSPQVHGDKWWHGRHISKDCTTCKGIRDYLSQRYLVSILSKCSFTFVQVLAQPCLKIWIWWTTIKRNKYLLLNKKRKYLSWKNAKNKIMASNLGSMPFEPWNLILIKHGCEQQIKKKSLDISRIFVVH